MKQTRFLFLELKRMCGVRDNAYDKLTRTLAEVVLPTDNIMLPSLYLVEKVVQSRPPDSCLYHACPKDHFVWPHLPQMLWDTHKLDCCPTCAGGGRQSLRLP